MPFTSHREETLLSLSWYSEVLGMYEELVYWSESQGINFLRKLAGKGYFCTDAWKKALDGEESILFMLDIGLYFDPTSACQSFVGMLQAQLKLFFLFFCK